MSMPLDTSQIRNWRSIVTLLVFVITNIIVLSPFHVPIPVPPPLFRCTLGILSALRIIPPKQYRSHVGDGVNTSDGVTTRWPRFRFPMNFVTAPLIADLFLLAILAIGRDEVHDGTIGADNISPIDIMAFFLTLAYIAISIDASGLIRWLAFKVLQKGGKDGRKLFFYLYVFFFGLGSFIGNDPIILSGTAFLAYMTRVSSNIRHPRAWIHSQFAVANTASAILVSSNPTNLVLAGAFNIKFIVYTANMIVPVIVTAIIMFPFLLYIVFKDEYLIPKEIKIHSVEQERPGLLSKKPVNPNIPHAKGNAEDEDLADNYWTDDQGNKILLHSLEEVLNPFLDKWGAGFGAVIMATTLVTILALNAASQSTGEHPVFWVTLPAAFVMFCWDLGFGWLHRHETRDIAEEGRKQKELARALKEAGETNGTTVDSGELAPVVPDVLDPRPADFPEAQPQRENGSDDEKDHNLRLSVANADLDRAAATRPEGNGTKSTFERDLLTPGAAIQAPDGNNSQTPTSADPPRSSTTMLVPEEDQSQDGFPSISASNTLGEKDFEKEGFPHTDSGDTAQELIRRNPNGEIQEMQQLPAEGAPKPERKDALAMSPQTGRQPVTLVSLSKSAYEWSQETFPTVTAVVAHLPFALVPFALSMFVLVQGLVSRGWVQVFAYGWDHWVRKTGTIGSIGGMGFLSVVLCNFAGTNIGTTILLSRVIQAWRAIHASGTPISDRTFWATVYSMALGVNYGAFSAAFSASLAGLLWRDILARKHIHVKSFDFARVNLPIIAIAMSVGCAVLVGEVYIMRQHPANEL